MRRPRPQATACRCAGTRSAPRTRRPPSRAAARSRTSSWPPTPTASSPPCGCDLLADMGAYLQLVTPGIPLLGAFLYAGVYDVPGVLASRAPSVFTNHDADRRLPRRRAARGDVRHRAGDGRAGRARSASTRSSCAGATSSRPTQFPYTAFTGLVYDSRRLRRRALDKAARAGRLRRAARRAGRRAVRRATTKHLGIGVSTYFEMCGLAPSPGAGLAELRAPAAGRRPPCACCRPARSRSSPARRRTARATRRAWSMIVADKLGVGPDDVEVLHSDTAIARSGSTPTARGRWPSAASPSRWRATR